MVIMREVTRIMGIIFFQISMVEMKRWGQKQQLISHFVVTVIVPPFVTLLVTWGFKALCGRDTWRGSSL